MSAPTPLTASPPVGVRRPRRTTWLGLLFVLPALVLLTLFAFYPTFSTLWDSVFRIGMPTKPARFVGLANFLSLFDDPTFYQVVRNNVVYAAVTIPLSTAIALGMALWANAALPGRTFLRLAYFTPTLLPMIAAANLWLYFYTPDLGLFDRIGAWFGLASINWLGEPSTALWAVTAVTVWKEAGFFMLFYLAALQSIAPELKEAAAIEGAGRWYYTRRIAWPLLMPTTLFVVVNATINSITLIDHLFVLTKGGPDNTSKLLLYWIWENAFAYFDESTAAALTVLVIVVLAVVGVAQFLFAERRAHYP